MTWGLIWLMFALKIPLAGLIYIVWWAIKQEPDESSSRDDDGGIKRNPATRASRSRAIRAVGRTAIPRRPRRRGCGPPARGPARSSARTDRSTGAAAPDPPRAGRLASR